MVKKKCPKGKKRVKGKCVRKKSYNPFKMWGSWIGLIILSTLLFIPYILAVISTGCESGPEHGAEACGYTLVMALYGAIPMAIVGFLIGWGIHSLIRRIKIK